MICTKCKVEKKKIEFYFYSSQCKDCYRLYREVRRGKLKESGLDYLIKKRTKTEREKYMIVEEWWKFEDELEGEGTSLLWRIIATTGLRLREGLAIKKDEFDFDHLLLHVPTLKRKHGKRPILDVDIPPSICDEVSLLPDGPLFTISAMWAWKSFKRIAKQAGLNRRYSPHALRHMQGMLTAEASEGDPYKIKAKLRHATIASGEVYVHLLPALRTKLSKEIWGKMERKK